MKKLILHIGMHKTGTSSVQETLGNAGELLKAHNIWYPSMKEHNHTVNFTPIFSNDPLKDITFIMKEITRPEQAIEEQRRLKRLWEKELNKIDCELTIISAEGCSMLMEERVKEMKNFLDQYFDEIKIIMYVRDPRSFFASSIQQWLKHMDKSIEDFSIAKPNQLFTRRLPAYVNVFGKENIVVRPFSKNAFKNDDLIDDFFDSIKVEIDTSKITRININESLGHNATILLSEYNKKYPGFIDKAYNEERGLVKNVGIVLDLFNKVDHGKFHLELNFSQEEADYLNNEIRYINQFLDEKDQFKTVMASNEPKVIPTIKDIESEYLLDLINEYNKKIEELKYELSMSRTLKTIIMKNFRNIKRGR